jgi:hypothetical protein
MTVRERMGVLLGLVFAVGPIGADEVVRDLVNSQLITLRADLDDGGGLRQALLGAVDAGSIEELFEADSYFREHLAHLDDDSEEVQEWRNRYPIIQHMYVGVSRRDSPSDIHMDLHLVFDHWLETHERYGFERGPEQVRLRFGNGSWFSVAGLSMNRDDVVRQSSFFIVDDDDAVRSIVEEMERQELLTVEILGAGGVPRQHRFDVTHLHDWIVDTRSWVEAPIR